MKFLDAAHRELILNRKDEAQMWQNSMQKSKKVSQRVATLYNYHTCRTLSWLAVITRYHLDIVIANCRWSKSLFGQDLSRCGINLEECVCAVAGLRSKLKRHAPVVPGILVFSGNLKNELVHPQGLWYVLRERNLCEYRCIVIEVRYSDRYHCRRRHWPVRSLVCSHNLKGVERLLLSIKQSRK